MAVSIDDIKKLRESTGVSMMACKSALEEANGDFDGAIDVLRKKGESKAADRAERVTENGLVAIKIDSGKAYVVKLLAETDFVSISDDFVALGDLLVDKLSKGEISVEDRDFDVVSDAVLKLGENIRVGDLQVVEGDVLGSYVHSNKMIGVVVSLSGGDEVLARDIAMHIAATSPRVISPEEVSDELVQREKGIWAEQLRAEGKPDEIVEKIMLGKEKKFREENALLKQVFVKDPEKTIEQLLADAKAEVKSFIRFAV